MKQNRIGWRRLLALLLAVCLLGGLTANVFAFDNVVASGTCGAEGDGSNLSWKFCSDGVLTITGSGAMKDYERYDAPWYGQLCSYSIPLTLVLDDRITHIGSYAFCDIRSTGFAGELHLPYSLVSIGEAAFYLCSGFTGSLTLPSGLTTIGNSAFYDCSSLTGDLVIPENCVNIGEYAFYRTGFTGKLSILSALPSIAAGTFGSVHFTGTLRLPSTVRQIENWAFQYCSFTGNLIIPEGCTSIGRSAFESTLFSGSLNLPSTIRSIGEWAFRNCAGFTGSLTLPDGLDTLESYSFQGCSGFAGTLQIPGSLKEIGEYAFTDTFFTKLILNDGIETIGAGAFHDCSALNGTVRIPNSVTMIGRGAFEGTERLTGMILSNKLEKIGEAAFSDSGISGTLVIPEGVSKIEDYTFRYCKNLTGVKLPKTLVSIGESAFNGCSGLHGNLRLPDKLTTIGRSAFYECSGLTGLTPGSELYSIGAGAFERCSGIQGKIVFGEKITTIGGGAFSDCESVSAFCFLGDAPTGEIGGNGSGQSFPEDAIICYIEGKTGWKTGYFMFWNGYKLETWDGRVTKPIDEDETPGISDASVYDEETTNRVTFRIYAAGADLRDPPDGFQITIDGKTYRSTRDSSYGYEEIRAEKPKGYTGKIMIAKEGYHTYEMPGNWANILANVLMTPKTVTGPFAQTLYSKGGNLLVYGDWIDVYQRAPGKDAQDPVNLYALINWNGHGAGKVWLQQGETKIDLDNDRWTSCAALDQLEPNKTVYLCAEAADGAAMRTRTQIKIHEAANVSLDIGAGSLKVPTDGGQDELKILENVNLELDLSELFQDTAIKISVGLDGSFKGILGVKLAEGSDVEAAYGTMKDTFKRLKDPKSSALNRDIAKELDKFIKENGFTSTPRSSKLGVKGDIQVMSIFSGNFKDGTARITELDAALIGSAALSYTHQTIVALPTGPIPAYLKVALASSLQLMLKMTYDEELKELVPKRMPLDFSMSLAAEVGPGWEGYFSCGVKGTGELKFYGFIPIVADDITATLAAKIGLVGTLYGFSGEWDVVKTKEMAFWENGWFVWHEYTPKDDSLSGLAFRPDTTMQTMTFAAAQQPGRPLAQKVSGYSAPDMVQLADGRLLAVWTADVPGRKLSDRGGIYYSVLENGAWSAPKLVWDDGTNDCAPTLQTVGSDVWLTWQNHKTPMNAENLKSITVEQITANCDLAAACFDPSSNTFTDAGNVGTTGYGYALRLTRQNNQLTAAWTQSTANGSETTETVWTAVRKTGKWSGQKQGTADWYQPAQTLPASWDAQTEAPAASARQCFSTDSYDAIVYTAEDENGVNQIYALWNDGYGWGEPFALTAVQSGSIGGFSAVIDEDEQIHILANVLTLGENGEYQSADLMLFEKALGADLTVSEADYVRRTLVPGKTVTLTAEVTNNGTKTVAGVHVSALDGSQLLTEADFGITLLPGQTKTAYLNYELPESSTLTGVTLRVVPQEGADADESDNTAQCAFQLVDLSVEDVTSVVYGESTLLQAQIVNRGQKTSETTSVVFHLGTPDGEVLGTADLGAIEAGGLEQAELTLNRTLDDREMIYVEVPVQTDENLYGNNTNYGVVIVMPQQAQTSSVSESYADGTLTLQISLESVTTDVRAVAAAYDAAGRLMQTAALTGSGGSLTMELRTGVKPASWKLFLLDAETNQPICACVEG